MQKQIAYWKVALGNVTNLAIGIQKVILGRKLSFFQSLLCVFRTILQVVFAYSLTVFFRLERLFYFPRLANG